MPTTFAELGIPAELVSTVSARGIETPFAIQSLTVADGCAGHDLCGRAPTGSGKTIAFGIPLVARLAGRSARRPRGLVLVPTRELAALAWRSARISHAHPCAVAKLGLRPASCVPARKPIPGGRCA